MEGINASSQKLKYYTQNSIKDPYLQISESGFTPLGNLKTYGVANLYDRPEPTKLRDLKELYTVPHNTTPFLGQNVPSRKYISVDSEILRYPVYQNRKTATDTSQVTVRPSQVYLHNPNVSPELNNFYQQATTIGLPDGDYQIYGSGDLDPSKPGLGQGDLVSSSRIMNRWDIVDPKITQNVNNIVMNFKNLDGSDISLHGCGISSRNELRNYVEVTNC